jgi:hypothetical protein
MNGERVDVVAVLDAETKRLGELRTGFHDRYMPLIEARAAVAELIEAAGRMMDYADDDYVPNVAFAQLKQALARIGATHER